VALFLICSHPEYRAVPSFWKDDRPYAADMMIPAIPLHQETRCEVSLRPELWCLRWAKEITSILGKIVTTLALITFSGVLNVRPQE
jgi:hypothetical protein